MSEMTADEKSMTIMEHLNELRKRLFVVLIALAAGVVINFYFAPQELEIMAVPIGGLSKLQAIAVTESVGVYMKVSVLGGLIIALPVIFYEIIGFVAPGLTRSEKRWLFMAIPFAVILFVCGVVFSYLVMMPAAIPFLVSFLNIQNIPTVSNYVDFVTSLMFWLGVSFETPLIVFILARLGLVNAGGLLKQWRIAVVVSSILAAVITPTVDLANMALLMAPLLALYLISVLMAVVARIGAKKKSKES